jgi:hypothetical protein
MSRMDIWDWVNSRGHFDACVPHRQRGTFSIRNPTGHFLLYPVHTISVETMALGSQLGFLAWLRHAPRREPAASTE